MTWCPWVKNHDIQLGLQPLGHTIMNGLIQQLEAA